MREATPLSPLTAMTNQEIIMAETTAMNRKEITETARTLWLLVNDVVSAAGIVRAAWASGDTLRDRERIPNPFRPIADPENVMKVGIEMLASKLYNISK